MANPTDIQCTCAMSGPIRAEDADTQLRTEWNKLITNLRVLTLKLDADAGVTDTDYTALVTSAAATGPAKLVVKHGL